MYSVLHTTFHFLSFYSLSRSGTPLWCSGSLFQLPSGTTFAFCWMSRIVSLTYIHKSVSQYICNVTASFILALLCITFFSVLITCLILHYLFSDFFTHFPPVQKYTAFFQYIVDLLSPTSLLMYSHFMFSIKYHLLFFMLVTKLMFLESLLGFTKQYPLQIIWPQLM